MAESEVSQRLAEGLSASDPLTRERNVAPSASWIGLAGVVVCAAAVLLVAASVPSDQAFGRGLVELLIVGAPIASGLYVLGSGTHRRFAFVLVWVGFAWSVTALTESSQSALFTTGRVWTWLILPSAVFLLLAFPDGRVASGFDSAVFWGFVGVSLLLFIGTAPLVQAFPPKTLWSTCTTDCPANALFVLSRQPGWMTQVVLVREWLIEFLWLGVFWSMLRRWRAASPLNRRATAPVFVAGGLLGLFQIAHVSYRQLGGSTNTVVALSSAWTLSIAVLCVTFPLGLFWHRRLLGRALATLGPALRESHSPGKVRDALAAALADPTLELLVHQGDRDRWRDSLGSAQIWPRPLPSGRAATEIPDQFGVVDVVLVHDVALCDDRELLDGVAGIVAASCRYERLAVDLKEAIGGLEESRRRIAEAATQERARIERDLHDGAQQRLLALGMKINQAARHVQSNPATSALLNDLGRDLELARQELRSLAHGVYPPTLAAYGIAPAIEELSLVEQSPLPIYISDSGVPRQSMEIESAVYFTIVEAMQNATTHAVDATGVWINLHQTDHTLQFEVRDDGRGFAADTQPGRGLQNMHDRIEAIGGQIAVESKAAYGTRVAATIPLPNGSCLQTL